jgi:hypothetical protein
MDDFRYERPNDVFTAKTNFAHTVPAHTMQRDKHNLRVSLVTHLTKCTQV